MNKLIALFAMIAGIVVVADADAAGRTRRTKKAPVIAEEPAKGADKPAEEPAKGADKPAEEPAKGADKPADKEDKAVKSMTFTERKDACVAWAKAHPKTAIAAGAGSAVVVGLTIDAAVRGKNSLIGKAYSKMFKREARYQQMQQLLEQKKLAAQ